MKLYVASLLFLLSSLFVEVASFAETQPQTAAPTSIDKTPFYLEFEQRVALSYILEAYGKSTQERQAIANRAVDFFKATYERKVQRIKVSNFNEFLQAFRGPWPNTESLNLDLEYIEKMPSRGITLYVSDSPRIQRKIDAYVSWQYQQILKTTGKDFSPTKIAEMIATGADDETLKDYLFSRTDVLLKKQFDLLQKIGNKISNNELGDAVDPQMKILLSTLFNEYYSRLSLDSQKLILSTFLGANLFADDLDKFEMMVINSGPIFQKLLQVFARRDWKPRLKELFRRLEKNARPVPEFQVKELFQKEMKNYDFTSFEVKKLAVATMKEAHRAKIRWNGKIVDAVASFLKPGIAERVFEDSRILKEIAPILDNNVEFQNSGAPPFAPIAEDLSRTVLDELDLNATVERQEKGKIAYTTEIPLKMTGYKTVLDLGVPGIFKPKTATTEFMVQELAFGGSAESVFTSYEDLAPDLKQRTFEALAYQWLYEAFLGTGQFHSDMHPGNFLVRLSADAIHIRVLDWGMGGTLSRDMQNQMLLLGLGITSNNPDMIAQAYVELSDEPRNQISPAQFKKRVLQHFHEIRNFEDSHDMTKWTSWAMAEGLRFPYEFVGLNRGLVTIMELVKNSGSNWSLDDLVDQLAKKNSKNIYQRLREENVKRSDMFRVLLEKMGAVKNKFTPPVCSEIFLTQ
jgi:predicted unusual protein kinase regulating ubiquinone biosynthesis (AarF/ABC1/UbiB family)